MKPVKFAKASYFAHFTQLYPFKVTTTMGSLKKQLVANPTADPGAANLIPAQSHTFVEIDHEIIFTVILLLILLIQEGLLSVTSKKYWLTT